MKHFLYKTTCILTGHFYFGIHSSVSEDAWYLGSGKRLKEFVALYGKHNFKREILQTYQSRLELEAAETKIIQEHWKQDTRNIKR